MERTWSQRWALEAGKGMVCNIRLLLQGCFWPSPGVPLATSLSSEAACSPRERQVGLQPQHLLSACAMLLISPCQASSTLSAIDFLPRRCQAVCSHLPGTELALGEQQPSMPGPSSCLCQQELLPSAWAQVTLCGTHQWCKAELGAARAGGGRAACTGVWGCSRGWGGAPAGWQANTAGLLMPH